MLTCTGKIPAITRQRPRRVSQAQLLRLGQAVSATEDDGETERRSGQLGPRRQCLCAMPERGEQEDSSVTMNKDRGIRKKRNGNDTLTSAHHSSCHLRMSKSPAELLRSAPNGVRSASTTLSIGHVLKCRRRIHHLSPRPPSIPQHQERDRACPKLPTRTFQLFKGRSKETRGDDLQGTVSDERRIHPAVITRQRTCQGLMTTVPRLVDLERGSPLQWVRLCTPASCCGVSEMPCATLRPKPAESP
jgi:hypothetical protein